MGRLPMPLRVVMSGTGLALMHPGTITDLIGLALGGPIHLWQCLRLCKAPA